MKIFHHISSLFTVKKCFACNNAWHFFCLKCIENCTNYSPFCYVCRQNSDNFIVHEKCRKWFLLNQVIVLTEYRQTWIKKLLRHAKYYGKYQAYEDIIIPNVEFFKEHIDTNNSILVPVPMNILRRWKRWYNQSQIIADLISQKLDIPVNNKLVSRTKHTKQQSKLDKKERLSNLQWAFKLHTNKFSKNTTIYLVDDIVSSGATLHEIANLLQDNGYKDIKAIVLASN